MELMNLSCEGFLEELASKAAAPGGGGASALVGAAGVALGSMVGSLTVGKKKYAAVEADIIALNVRAEALRKRLEALVQADADAFTPLAAAYGLPKDTPEQAAHKAAVLEKALDAACAVPLEIMEKCAEGIALVEEYAAKGSVMAVSVCSSVSASSAAAGRSSVTRNVGPLPTLLSAPIAPSIRSTIFFTMARPRPLPRTLLTRVSTAREKPNTSAP